MNDQRAPWQLPPALAALLAHELGNPLGIARVSAQDLDADLRAFHGLLVELGGEDLDPAVRLRFEQRFRAFSERLDAVAAAHQRMAGLVEELRAHGQGARAALQDFDLAERVRAALRLAAAQTQVTLDVSEELPVALPWRGPLAVLDRVLLNLALNAAQAVARRAAQDAADFRGRLRCRSLRSEDRLVVEIDDNGVGIPPQDLERVFLPGFSRRLESGGSGLGLAYAREAVRSLGGDICVASLPGQGTRFRLWLPVAPS